MFPLAGPTVSAGRTLRDRPQLGHIRHVARDPPTPVTPLPLRGVSLREYRHHCQRSALEMHTGRIFCDESGFTGPDLLAPSNPYFSFATVAISDAEAEDMVRRVIRDYSVQGGELKGRRLLRYSKGRRAIEDILDALSGRYKVAVFEKRFALACKFYEYIFEPALASHSLIFYALGFHLFIANLLYVHFMANGHHADRIFAEFQHFMRTFDESRLLYLNGKLEMAGTPPALDLIGAFAVSNFGSIREEMETLIEGPGVWTLDLTSTALHSLLAEWAESFETLEVTCDESKPLAHSKVVHDAMVGNKRAAYHTFMGDRRRLTYNLGKPIELASSTNSPGIQLADVVAAVSAAAFESPEDVTLECFRQPVYEGLVPQVVVLPLATEVDLKEDRVVRNYAILRDLVRRSIGGIELLPGAAEFALEMTARLRLPLPDLDAAFEEK